MRNNQKPTDVVIQPVNSFQVVYFALMLVNSILSIVVILSHVSFAYRIGNVEICFFLKENILKSYQEKLCISIYFLKFKKRFLKKKLKCFGYFEEQVLLISLIQLTTTTQNLIQQITTIQVKHKLIYLIIYITRRLYMVYSHDGVILIKLSAA